MRFALLTSVCPRAFAAHLEPRILDFGLNVLDTETDKITICGTEPTTFTEANSTFLLGAQTYSAGAAFGSPATAAPNGRKVTSVAITAGSVTATGTANWEACVDTVNSRLNAVLALSASQAVTSGNTFGRAAYDIRLADR